MFSLSFFWGGGNPNAQDLYDSLFRLKAGVQDSMVPAKKKGPLDLYGVF